jgi:hypothetical protein
MKFSGYVGINSSKLESTFSIGNYYTGPYYSYTLSEIEKAKKDRIILPGYELWDGTILNDRRSGVIID